MTMSGETCGMPLGEVAGGAPCSGVLLHDISQGAAEPVSGLCTYLPDRATSHGQDAGGVRMALPPDQVANAGFDASGAIEFWDTTNQQDWQVSQLSQAGISSRVYAPGLYSALESMVAAWDRE